MSSTLIAIETSTEFCSVAVLRDGRVEGRDEHAGQTHSERLLPMVAEVLAAAGITLADCDAVAFGAGPGSFTGLRIACGVAQGLAFGADLPVVAVGTLMALAEGLRAARADQPDALDGPLLCALDARMGEVYWAVYEWDETGEWRERVAPCLSRPDDVGIELAEAGIAPRFGCGGGFASFAALRDLAPQVDDTIRPVAAAMVRIAGRALARGEGAAAASAMPLYVRNHVALTTAEREQAREQRLPDARVPA